VTCLPRRVGAVEIDGLLVLSFGGPESPDEVMPFLRRVTRGRGIPEERLAQVATQYEHFGGVSPINARNRDLVRALEASAPPGTRIYLGNRNSAPFVSETVARMSADGVARAAVFITSAYSSYSGCRQYRENLADAAEQTGALIDWRVLPRFHDHPLFTRIWADRLAAVEPTRSDRVVFVTHSLPMSAAAAYLRQHKEVARSVVAAIEPPPESDLQWDLAFQSRSGPPGQEWLEPDISDALAAAATAGVRRAIVAPIGFCSDNLEIGWDLDVTAARVAADLGIEMVRLEPPQSDPRFADLVWDLITTGDSNTCALDCCPNPRENRSAIGDSLAD
jgi:protoporphyrin/coproporphyrin ferrochelatase